MAVLRALRLLLHGLVYVPPQRETTFHERLLPWPVYGGLSVVRLVLLPFFLAGMLGAGRSNEGSRILGYVVIGPAACIGLLLTTLSCRQRRERSQVSARWE